MSEPTQRRRRFQGLTASLSMLTMLGALAGALFLSPDGGDSGGGAGEGGTGAGDGGGQGDGAGTGDGGQGAGDTGDKATDKADDKPTKIEFTKEQQDHIAKLLGEEKAKATEKAKKEAEATAAEAAKRAKMDEADRLKAEKADAEKAASEATEKANARAIRADAKVAAVNAGVKADRVDAFLRVADLGDVKVNDDGDPDAKAISKAVADTLKDFPEFKAAPGKGGTSGGDHNGNGAPTRATTLEDAVNRKLAG